MYSGNGELTTKVDSASAAATTYIYDEFGNLRTVDLPDSRAIEYVVDGLSRRVGKKINGQLVQGFLYSNQLEPVAELDGSGNVVTTFVYAERANTPSYLLKDGRLYRLIANHLGSVRLVVDAESSSVAQAIDYDDYGNVLSDTNPGFQPFGYAGGIYDRDTGLTRFGARDYDPITGRWTTKDMSGFNAGDLNLYRYVGSDPVNFVDPRGLDRIVTFMNLHTTAYYDNDGNYVNSWQSNNAVTRDSLPGAAGRYRSDNVYPTEGPYRNNEDGYGPNDILKTDDIRGRWLHGGGSRLDDPSLPRQGWAPTEGCTRLQNEDIQNLVDYVRAVRAVDPSRIINYERLDYFVPTIVPLF